MAFVCRVMVDISFSGSYECTVKQRDNAEESAWRCEEVRIIP